MTRQEEIRKSRQIMNKCFDKAVHHYDIEVANHGFGLDSDAP